MPMTRDDWMKKRLARDFHTGEYIFDTNAVYRHQCFQEEVEMIDAELKAQKPAPVPNAEDLAWLNRAQGAVNPATGRRYHEEPGAARDQIEAMRAHVFGGGRIPAEMVAATEAVMTPPAAGAK